MELERGLIVLAVSLAGIATVLSASALGIGLFAWKWSNASQVLNMARAITQTQEGLREVKRSNDKIEDHVRDQVVELRAHVANALDEMEDMSERSIRLSKSRGARERKAQSAGGGLDPEAVLANPSASRAEKLRATEAIALRNRVN